MSIVKKIDGYYFRGYVPSHLQLKYGKKTQDKKLYTNNKKEALKLVKVVKIEFEYEIYARHSEMAKLDKKSVIRSQIDDYVEEYLIEREENLFNLPNDDIDKLFSQGYFYDNIEALQVAVSYKEFDLLPYFNDTLKQALGTNSKGLSKIEINEFRDYLAEKLLRNEELIRLRVTDGHYNFKSKDIPKVDKSLDVTGLSKNIIQDNSIARSLVPNLQQYHKEFIEFEYYGGNNNNPSTDTISKHNLVIKSLLMYYGEDINVNEITAKDMEDYRAKLEKLPLKWSKKEDYKNCKTLNEIIETRDKLGKDFKMLKPNTVGPKYISKVKAFFNYVSSHENNFKNPVSHLKYGNNKKNLNSTDWDGFLDEELEAIFATDFYTSELEVNIKNNIELVYAPILALYSTMRRNELSSLYTNDIKELEGVYFFDINNNDEKTTKTKKSNRYIPIHLKIIEAGFLDYYKHMNKQGNVRLWTNLKKFITNTNNDKGGYGKEIGVWFNKLVDDYVTKDSSRVFHILRNNAIDSLKQNSGANRQERYAIDGHTDKSDSDERRMDKLYSNPTNAKILKPFVDL